MPADAALPDPDPTDGAASGGVLSPVSYVVRRPATYDDLQRAVAAAGRDIANRRSALNGFMATHGRAGHDVIGPELADGFDDALRQFKADARRGGAEPSTLASRVSRVRAVRRLAAELTAATVVGLSFGDVFAAACAVSPMPIPDLAKRAHVPRSTLYRWARRRAVPATPDARAAVARLEPLLGLASGSLLALLPQPPYYAPPRGFAKLFVDALEAAGLALPSLAARAGVAYEMVRLWARGRVPDAVGRTRDLPRVEAALGLPVGTLGARLPALPARAVPYRATLTAAQQAELDRYVAYKTDRTQHKKSRRPSAFWRTRPDGEEPPSARHFRMFLGYFYGYLALPTDAPDPLLRGLGRPNGSQSFADLCDADAVIGFLKFRAARTLHNAAVRAALAALEAEVDGEPAPPAPPSESLGYNADTWSNVAAVRSMLRKSTGYIWQAHDLAAAVARAFPGVPSEEALVRWRAALASADEDLVEFQHYLYREARVYAPREARRGIARILALPRPMDALSLLRERAQRAWEDARHYPGSDARRAARLRDYLLIALLCAAPLRKRHWRIMRYRHDNTGHLRRVTDPAREHFGHYEIFFAQSEFKSLAEFREADYLAEVPTALTPVVDLYLQQYRPALVGAQACDYVFRPARSSVAPAAPCDTRPGRVDEFLAAATRRLLPDYAPNGFRTHAVRHAIATHLVKNYPLDGFTRAADALHNTVEMIKRHYGHLSGVDRTRRSMRILDEEYRLAPGGAAREPQE